MPALSGPSLGPKSDAPPDSLVVLLHGIGANGEDLIGLADVFAPRFPTTVFHSPNAPERFSEAAFGFQWYDRMPIETRSTRIRGVESLVNDYIEELLRSYNLPPHRCVLAGFSQGSMVALHVAPRREGRLAGVIGFSGSLITSTTLAAETRSQPPFMLIHGSEDTVVDPTETAEAGRALDAAGFDVEAHLLPGLGHGIDQRGLEIAAAFMEKVLS